MRHLIKKLFIIKLIIQKEEEKWIADFAQCGALSPALSTSK
jgi:hypothetical protein